LENDDLYRAAATLFAAGKKPNGNGTNGNGGMNGNA
jgi:hypothetical protein